jgi:hypothetical protein
MITCATVGLRAGSGLSMTLISSAMLLLKAAGMGLYKPLTIFSNSLSRSPESQGVSILFDGKHFP